MKVELFTPRLKLVPVQEKDLDELHRFFATEYVRKFLCDDNILSREQVTEFIQTSDNLFLDKNYGLWWIIIASTDERAGIVGLWNFFEEKQGELLYAILSEYTGKGFVREASFRIMHYAFSFLGYDNLMANCDLPNLSSIKVAEKLGMTRLREELINEKQMLSFEMKRNKFKEIYMNEISVDNSKYPVGKLTYPSNITEDHIKAWIDEIEKFPALLKSTIANWSKEQLSTRTKPDGWMVKQVVHHLADSHMNSFIRFKLALTETNPTIKPYAEDRWAELDDGNILDVESSLQILEGLHKRWVVMLRSLSPFDLEKTFFHPEHNKSFRLDATIASYAWHGRHHLGFIQSLKFKMGW